MNLHGISLATMANGTCTTEGKVRIGSSLEPLQEKLEITLARLEKSKAHHVLYDEPRQQHTTH